MESCSEVSRIHLSCGYVSFATGQEGSAVSSYPRFLPNNPEIKPTSGCSSRGSHYRPCNSMTEGFVSPDWFVCCTL